MHFIGNATINETTIYLYREDASTYNVAIYERGTRVARFAKLTKKQVLDRSERFDLSAIKW